MLTDREAHLVGDIVREAEHVGTFLDGVDQEAFAANLEKVYAVQKALQNLCEACIQLDGRPGQGRFETLFPKASLRDIKTVGNALRHDYGAINPTLLRNQVASLVPGLRDCAERVLSDLRRLRGGADDAPNR